MNYIELIKNFGEYNNWRGYVDYFFTKKQQRDLKRLYGIANHDSIKTAYLKAIA